MINDLANNRQKYQAELKTDRTMHNKNLLGKVVLLIGNDTAVLQNLVMKLARKGADVALLCWQMPLEIARKLKEHVKSLGKQLILIERAENQRLSIEQLIHNVITKWGHFDIFIDVSTRNKKGGTAVKNKAPEKELRTAWLPPKWQLTRIILEEMALS